MDGGSVVSTVRATAYTVYPDGYEGFANSDKHLWTLIVEERNPEAGLWSVRDIFGCLDRNGLREYEPQPSSRGKRFLKRFRFPLDEALAIAEKYVDSVVVNLRTAAEASAAVAARKREGGRR